MKLNSNPIEVPYDSNLVESLSYIFREKQDRCDVVIESGTYHGLGTTKIVIDAIKKSDREIPFITMEPNKEAFQVAKRNLEKYSFVNLLYATSISLDDALDYISNDKVLINHNNYPNILIDDVDDPIYYYRTEIFSCFNENPIPPVENMLKELIEQYKIQCPLFVLDSCGGLGFAEFNIVFYNMIGFPYYIFLDDVNHVKHFRSANWIEKDKEHFDVIFYNGRIMVAKHKGKNNV